MQNSSEESDKDPQAVLRACRRDMEHILAALDRLAARGDLPADMASALRLEAFDILSAQREARDCLAALQHRLADPLPRRIEPAQILPFPERR